MALIIFASLAFQNWTYLVDDVLIFFRHAEQFHRGYGWVMNPGEPVNGCTSPLALWLITALSSVVSVDWSIMALKGLGLICGVVVLLCTRSLFLRFMPGQYLLASLVTLLIAYRLDFAVSMINGLETPFACTGLLAGVLWFWKAEEGQSLKREAVAVACFIIAGLARPEMAMIYPVLCVVRFAIYRRGNWLLLAYLVPFMAWAAFCYSFYGDPLPNTYYAKRATLAEGLAEGSAYLSSYLLAPVPVFGGWIVLACAIAVWMRNRKNAWVVLTVATVYSATILRTHGDWMPEGRFAVPILPLVVIGWVIGAHALAGALKPLWESSPRPVAAGLALYLAGSGLHSINALALRVVEDMESRYENQPFTLPTGEPLSMWVCGGPNGGRQVAEWVQKNVKPGQLVLHSEMGLTPTLNPDVRFIDSFGLCDSTIARMEGLTHYYGGVHTKHQADWYKTNTPYGKYIESRRPDFVILSDFPSHAGGVPPAHKWRRVSSIRMTFDLKTSGNIVMYERR